MGSSLCLAVRKKKEKDMTVALPEIPEQLLMEILIRLPATSLMRFKCVSKLCFSIITSRYFTDLFLKSSSRGRLFAYIVDEVKTRVKYALLTSSSSSSSPSPSSHDQSVSVIDQDMTLPKMEGYFVNAVRGLVCFRIERRVQICNIHTRQIVDLPIIRSEGIGNNVWSCFGHDPVHNEYKVLSLVWEVTKEYRVRSEHHVLVLGAGASWKNTQCHIHHRPLQPYSRGISINGVMYYKAWTNENTYVIMSFDLSSEEFSSIELPTVPIFRNLNMYRTCGLINYKGRVACFDCLDVLSDPGVDVWVMEDADKSQWSEKKTFVLPVSQINFDLNGYQSIIGSNSGSCKVWLIKAYLTPNQSACFLIYDLERNEITGRVEIRPSLLGSFKDTGLLLSIFWDEFESIMYLET